MPGLQLLRSGLPQPRAVVSFATVSLPASILPPGRMHELSEWNAGQQLRVLQRPLGGNHVVQLPPLHGRFTAAFVGYTALSIALTVGGLSTFLPPSIPYDLHCGIVRKSAGQQLEGGELATPHDDESWVTHKIDSAGLDAPNGLRSIPVFVDDRPQSLVQQSAATKK